ncbi:helix-turn-helix transcriptional regulator [Nocardia macrotermitis]|uniref:helix-turn-helix transcriptional regulator n=1 Tax=Nocardia macrotermitis TaxID=2585198 RepID=UPI0029E8086D|nr:helix-turn-helix transcriptional regulator [Nocardia macrotermitis]
MRSGGRAGRGCPGLGRGGRRRAAGCRVRRRGGNRAADTGGAPSAWHAGPRLSERSGDAAGVDDAVLGFRTRAPPAHPQLPGAVVRADDRVGARGRGGTGGRRVDDRIRPYGCGVFFDPAALGSAHRARRLLSDPDLPIAEIARRTGFSDPGYFSRQFRRTFGLAPRSWRATPPT